MLDANERGLTVVESAVRILKLGLADLWHLNISGTEIDKYHKIHLVDVGGLDSRYLLSHLRATFSDFDIIQNWEDFNSRESILGIPEEIRKKLEKVSHGMALMGKCGICESWRQSLILNFPSR